MPKKLNSRFGSKESLVYYFWASYRRKLLDQLLEAHRAYFKGVVLDIGGRDRGRFRKPKEEVRRWIFADVQPELKPDIVLDVAHMEAIDSESIDVILATELFEHVGEIEEGLDECYRVLKKDGRLIISVPFLYPLHADPFDFQRWTKDKWKIELEKRGFHIEKLFVMGNLFTVLMDFKKMFIKNLPVPLRWLAYLFYPIFDLIVKLDHSRLIRRWFPIVEKFHGGYFIVAKKS